MSKRNFLFLFTGVFAGFLLVAEAQAAKCPAFEIPPPYQYKYLVGYEQCSDATAMGDIKAALNKPILLSDSQVELVVTAQSLVCTPDLEDVNLEARNISERDPKNKTKAHNAALLSGTYTNKCAN